MLEKFFSAYFKPFVVLYVIPTEICFLSLISYQVPFFFFFFFSSYMENDMEAADGEGLQRSSGSSRLSTLMIDIPSEFLIFSMKTYVVNL